MNEKKFSEILHDIEQERVPADMDLWNEIKTQVNAASSIPSRRRRIRQQRLIILAAVFVLIMGTVAVWAQGPGDKKNPLQDEGLRDVEEAGLLIELNETQTQNNISATLEYAYADVNRISLAFMIEAEVAPEMHLNHSQTLTDSAGNEYPTVFGGGGGGGGGGGDVPPETVTQTSQGLLNFEVPASVIDQESLDLILTIDVDGDVCFQFSEDCIYEPEDLADFTFEFTVELYQGIQFEVNQIVSDGEFEIEMREGVITPSATRIVICHEPLDKQWLGTVELRVNDELVTNDDGYMPITSSAELDENCRFLILTQSLMEADGEWELTIPYLISVTPPEPQAIVDYLNENGIPAQLTEDGMVDYANIEPPEGMDMDEFSSIMNNQPMPEEVHEGGPWVFTFEVDTDDE